MVKQMIRGAVFGVMAVSMAAAAKAEEISLAGWTLFFTSHTSNQCLVFDEQKGDSGSFTSYYKVFEARGGGEGKSKGKFKVYRSEKGLIMIKADESRICLGAALDLKGTKTEVDGNMFDSKGTAMYPGSKGEHPKIGDAKIDGVRFLLLKGKHTDPDKIDE